MTLGTPHLGIEEEGGFWFIRHKAGNLIVWQSDAYTTQKAAQKDLDEALETGALRIKYIQKHTAAIPGMGIAASIEAA